METKMPGNSNLSGIPTKNRYEPLSEDDTDMDTNTEERHDNLKNCNPGSKHAHKSSIKELKKTSPLVIHGEINNHYEFLKKVKNIVKDKFHIKYNKGYTEVFTKCKPDFQLLKTMWKENKVQFHTFTEKENKERAFVIRGLHAEMSTTDILEELKELGFNAIRSNLMKNTARPLYMVTFSADTEATQL